MAKIEEALAIGLKCHQTGDLRAAEQVYRRILAVDPHQPDALHLLGVIAHQVGQHQAAVEYIGRAIGLKGTESVFYNNLGGAYRALGMLAQAVACYRRALQLTPDYPEAENNLGIAFCDQGKLVAAIACYRRALNSKPDYAEAHSNLGSALKDQGNLDEAVACHRRAIELSPDFVEAHFNLGNALKDQGELDEAVVCFRRVLELTPQDAEAHGNLGNALKEQGRFDEAVLSHRRALEIKPDFAEAHFNLANTFKSWGRLADAIACYRKALEMNPDYAEACHNLGVVFQDQEELDESIACYRRALDLQPDFLPALGALIFGLQKICRWDDLESLARRAIEVVEQDREDVIAAPMSPFCFVALPTITSPRQQLRCARQWVARRMNVTAEPQRDRPPRRLADRNSKLTIGYLSADFRQHPVARLTVELFEKHDRNRFSIFGYSYGHDDGSPIRHRLINAFDRFVDLKDDSFGAAARRIAADEVDILIDLTGYTQNARTSILALRPAPIQVNYLGYPGTMGASFIDYILVDDFIVPADQQPFYSEKLVHLPGPFLLNDSQQPISPRIPIRADCGLPENGFVFCCFNDNYKITPAVFDVWMNLLKHVPESVLWLLEGNRHPAANLRQEAQTRGVAAERLVFAPRIDLADHLARHRLADLFLDTIPYNAHATASDALWAGCPVLTTAGQTFASRVAGSLLRTIGLPELVTTSLADYEALALRLARDTGQLAELRERLAANRAASPLFDARRFARMIETAYVSMWDMYAAGEPPRAFRVARRNGRND